MFPKKKSVPASITHEQLGKALYTPHHLVWPDDRKDQDWHWSWRAGDDNVPFVGFAVEDNFGEKALPELREMIATLDSLYDKKSVKYTAEDIAQCAETLVGFDRFLERKVGEFDITPALEKEKPLSLSQATRMSYLPLKNRGAELECLNKLVQLADDAIQNGTSTQESTILAQYGRDNPAQGVYIT